MVILYLHDFQDHQCSWRQWFYHYPWLDFQVPDLSICRSDLPVDCLITTFHYISSISLWHLLFPIHSSPTHLFSTLLIAKGFHLSPPLPSQSTGNDPQLDLFYLPPLHQKGFQGSFLRNMPRTGLSMPAMLLTASTMGGTSFHIRFNPLFLLASTCMVFRQHKPDHTLFLCLSALARNKYML